MEGSAVLEATLRIFERAFAAQRNVGPVLQAYLKRTAGDVQHAIELGARVRLCKGAYNEPPEIAYKNMPEIRTHYLEAGARAPRARDVPWNRDPRPALDRCGEGVRDRRGGYRATASSSRCCTGAVPACSATSSSEGWRLRIYVPFGTHWAGYFYRRVLERRENALFALSSIFSS